MSDWRIVALSNRNLFALQVILGTAVGSLLIVNHEGTVLETHQLRPDHPIEKLTWSTARNSG